MEQGIAQFCHGKSAPAKRLNKGDMLVYYSPKVAMDGNQKYQKFTAIGVVRDNETYEFDMGNGFVPFRRNIDYVKSALHVDVVPLIEYLPFIKNKQSWGGAFSFGFIQIDDVSFKAIAAAMLPMEISANTNNDILQVIRNVICNNDNDNNETKPLIAKSISAKTVTSKNGTLDNFVQIASKKRKI